MSSLDLLDALSDDQQLAVVRAARTLAPADLTAPAAGGTSNYAGSRLIANGKRA
jgi:hypothetical protein